MNPWPLKPAATQSPGRTSPEDRLVVGSDVVEALDEEGKRDELEAGQQGLDAGAHVTPPAVAGLVGVAGRGEVAGEHAAVCELLGREVPLGRDHERLEQALADRLAQEEVARLALDRQLRDQRPGLPAGRDDDVRRRRARPVREGELPAASVAARGGRPRRWTTSARSPSAWSTAWGWSR